MIFRKSKEEKILKLYAKELMNNRAEAYNEFMGIPRDEAKHFSFKHAMRVCLIAAIVLTLSFGLVVITANALGIKLFGFNMIETKTHTEITRNDDYQGEKKFYKPMYVPKGYEEVDVDKEFDYVTYVYKNKNGDAIYVESDFGNGLGNVNNEACQIHTETILGYETKIYEYDSGYSYWIFDKESICILIYGKLPREEFIKIIENLREE